MRFVSALIGFQGMVNEIVLGVLDPLPLDSTSKVETFHPHGVFPIQLLHIVRGSTPSRHLGFRRQAQTQQIQDR